MVRSLITYVLTWDMREYTGVGDLQEGDSDSSLLFTDRCETFIEPHHQPKPLALISWSADGVETDARWVRRNLGLMNLPWASSVPSRSVAGAGWQQVFRLEKRLSGIRASLCWQRACVPLVVCGALG